MMFRYNNSNTNDLKPFPILYTTHAHSKDIHIHTYIHTHKHTQTHKHTLQHTYAHTHINLYMYSVHTPMSLHYKKYYMIHMSS